MVLVDSSVWVDHFHHTEPRLTALLDAGEVATHSLVIGELACGQLSQRRSVLALLHALPGAVEASTSEVLLLIERERLHGAGLGIVDMHLLAAARLSDVRLWTRDKTLGRAALRLGVG
jgi:hypothetical protein